MQLSPNMSNFIERLPSYRHYNEDVGTGWLRGLVVPPMSAEGKFWLKLSDAPQIRSPTGHTPLALLRELVQRYGRATNNETQLVPGEMVLVELENTWYRACIQEILPDNHGKVFLIDEGRSVQVPGNTLKHYPTTLRRIPQQTVQCVFNVRRIVKLTDAIREAFTTITRGREVHVGVMQPRRGVTPFQTSEVNVFVDLTGGGTAADRMNMISVLRDERLTRLAMRQCSGTDTTTPTNFIESCLAEGLLVRTANGFQITSTGAPLTSTITSGVTAARDGSELLPAAGAVPGVSTGAVSAVPAVATVLTGNRTTIQLTHRRTTVIGGPSSTTTVTRGRSISPTQSVPSRESTPSPDRPSLSLPTPVFRNDHADTTLLRPPRRGSAPASPPLAPSPPLMPPPVPSIPVGSPTRQVPDPRGDDHLLDSPTFSQIGMITASENLPISPIITPSSSILRRGIQANSPEHPGMPPPGPSPATTPAAATSTVTYISPQDPPTTTADRSPRETAEHNRRQQNINAGNFAHITECPVCMEKYGVEAGKPKVLACGHTFCHTCLRSLKRGLSILCPTCRSRTILQGLGDVLSLPTNHSILGLMDCCCQDCQDFPKFRECPHCQQVICEPCFPKHLERYKRDMERKLGGLKTLHGHASNVNEACSREMASQHVKRLRNCIETTTDTLIDFLNEHKARNLEKLDDLLENVDSLVDPELQHEREEKLTLSDTFIRETQQALDNSVNFEEIKTLEEALEKLTTDLNNVVKQTKSPADLVSLRNQALTSNVLRVVNLADTRNTKEDPTAERGAKRALDDDSEEINKIIKIKKERCASPSKQ